MNMNSKKMQGFTLIELMIVIAILGILLAIAIPAYQDYTIRAKMGECASVLAPLKTGVSEYFISNGVFPQTIASVGTAAATKFCQAPTLAAGGVLDIANTASVGVAAGNVHLVMTPATNAAGDVEWTCSSTGTVKYAPGSCR